MPYKDPDKDKAVKKAWYLAHKAQQRARQKAQRAADPEKRRAYEKIYYQAHQQHVSGIHKRYYAKNRERLLAKARELDNAKRRAQGIPPRLILTQPPVKLPPSGGRYKGVGLQGQFPMPQRGTHTCIGHKILDTLVVCDRTCTSHGVKAWALSCTAL